MTKFNLAAASGSPQQTTCTIPPTRPGRSTQPPDRPGHLHRIRPVEVIELLSEVVEQTTRRDGVLAEIGFIQPFRFDTSQRYRLRVDCEWHGALVPGRAGECPKCMPIEEGERALGRVLRGPRDYTDYIRDSSID